MYLVAALWYSSKFPVIPRYMEKRVYSIVYAYTVTDLINFRDTRVRAARHLIDTFSLFARCDLFE